MAAPLAEELVRELAAEVRRFQSPRQALLWYRTVRARKMPHAAAMEPSSRSQRSASTAVTYARIAMCLGPWHEADEERDEPLALSALAMGYSRGSPEARAEADRRLAELMAHLVGGHEAVLADVLDRSERQTDAYVSYAGRVIGRRLRAEGLLEEGDG